MEYLKINARKPDRSDIERIASVVREGGIILYPTDTVYGLGCDPFDERALERIFLLKGRTPEKGVLVLVPSYEWLPRVAGEIGQEMLDLCRSWWPGPVTCLFKAGSGLPGMLAGAGGKIGVRIPDNSYLTDLMISIPGPLVSTSANLAGEPTSGRFLEISRKITNGVDVCVEDSEESMQERRASTVVDLSGNEPLIIRAGEGIEMIRAAGIREQESGRSG